MDKIKKWGATVAVILATATVVTGTWATADWLGIRPVLSREIVAMDARVAANTDAVLMIRWQNLHRRVLGGTISLEEQREYCKLSYILGMRGKGC